VPRKSFFGKYDLTPTTSVFLIILMVFFAVFLVYPIAYVFSQAFYLGENLLFNVDSSLQTELDSGILPEDLTYEFENNGLSIPSESGTTIVESGSKWELPGEDQSYVIKSENDRLNVYSKGRFSFGFFKLMVTNPVQRQR